MSAVTGLFGLLLTLGLIIFALQLMITGRSNRRLLYILAVLLVLTVFLGPLVSSLGSATAAALPWLKRFAVVAALIAVVYLAFVVVSRGGGGRRRR